MRLQQNNTYGAVKGIPAKINAALLSAAGNAQEVADAVLQIIETPAGEKQLRYLVSPESFGVDQINALSKQVQAITPSTKLVTLFRRPVA
jgi:hypothetical protein